MAISETQCVNQYEVFIFLPVAKRIVKNRYTLARGSVLSRSYFYCSPSVFCPKENVEINFSFFVVVSSGFHEAVGEAIALSVGTPKHLETLGLATKYVYEPAADINYLFSLAMEKLVLLPFSIAVDRWRWDIFRGLVNREEYNCHWHRLMERYAGTKPPVLRSEDNFDPGAKYHVPANVPYIR